ncbi:hypothetical protein RHGRI_026143 [Rhododendron griersonianum]|uniref:Uncharacterized protein n=1 Tax=Rhododendron griersonianum TaxID=479676 RepID=A0AAV6IT07_9ERIC|nr:hypothetical protein RHGRI_026143 [Rhododendron griersonianum]
MLSHRLMNLIVINVVSIIKIQEAQVFPSMPVGVWPKTTTKASNPKRQRQRRVKALKKGEQKFVAANVMGAIEKAFGSYNDNLESSTESSESLIEIESELNSSEVERAKRDGSILLYSSSSANNESSSSTSSEPRSVAKVVSVVMTEVVDEEQSSNPQQSHGGEGSFATRTISKKGPRNVSPDGTDQKQLASSSNREQA